MWIDIYGIDLFLLFFIALDFSVAKYINQFVEIFIHMNSYGCVVLFKGMNDKGMIVIYKKTYPAGTIYINK